MVFMHNRERLVEVYGDSFRIPYRITSLVYSSLHFKRNLFNDRLHFNKSLNAHHDKNQ